MSRNKQRRERHSRCFSPLAQRLFILEAFWEGEKLRYLVNHTAQNERGLFTVSIRLAVDLENLCDTHKKRTIDHQYHLDQ